MPVVLYKRQRQLLEFVKGFIRRNGYSPTITEICKAMGISSPATAYEHLLALEKKGVIKRAAGVARSIELVEMARDTTVENTDTDLPLLGYIAAGEPLQPYIDPNATFKVPLSFVPAGKQCFVLQVKGNSMIEDGIHSDDYVMICRQDNANNGDIVVALLESGLATLKRFFKEPDRIRLEPANATMSPIFATNVRIQGRVVALIRRYT